MKESVKDKFTQEKKSLRHLVSWYAIDYWKCGMTDDYVLELLEMIDNIDSYESLETFYGITDRWLGDDVEE